MTDTARLGLPLLAPEQAQKHVTHNEALLALDGVVHLSFDGVGTTEPPTVPGPGETHLIGESAEGEWQGRDGGIAVWTEGGWRFASPGEGWTGWDSSGETLRVFRNGSWGPPLRSLPRLGIGTDPDPTNRFSVRSEAALFTAIPTGDGGTGDVRLTLNKETETDGATLIFQSGWSGRAEIGLSGSDDFSFKVSADGSQFVNAIGIAAGSGFVTFERMFGARPGFPAIDGGVLAVETGYVVPSPEEGTSDEVEEIAGGFDGAMLVITGSAGSTLTFRSGIGNLKLGADRVLDNFDDALMLVRRGSDWIELSYADNG